MGPTCLRFVSLCHESGGRMSQATTTFLDSLVHRSDGSTSDQARFRTFASQRLACANASGMAKLILSFNNHIRRSDGAVVHNMFSQVKFLLSTQIQNSPN